MHKAYLRILETLLTIYVKLSLKLGKLVTLLSAQGGWGQWAKLEPELLVQIEIFIHRN